MLAWESLRAITGLFLPRVPPKQRIADLERELDAKNRQVSQWSDLLVITEARLFSMGNPLPPDHTPVLSPSEVNLLSDIKPYYSLLCFSTFV